MQKTEKQFHIHCAEGDVGRYVFLPGDPGRCEAIAAHFDHPVHIGMNRESHLGFPAQRAHAELLPGSLR